MLELHRFDDVMRIRMWSRWSAAAGIDVSAYFARGVVIDTGFPHSRRLFAIALERLRPSGAFVTHWHEDHAGNVALVAAVGLPIGMHAATEVVLREGPQIRTYRRVIWGRPPILRRSLERLDHPALICLHTPGHSADHQVVWDAERETLFAGDLWLGVRARAMHADEDPYRLLESIRRVHALGPKRMFDAHRGFVPHPVAALSAKAEWLAGTIAAIETRITAGWSDRAIRKSLLGLEEPVAYLSFGEYARMNLVRAVRRRYLCLGRVASASCAITGS